MVYNIHLHFLCNIFCTVIQNCSLYVHVVFVASLHCDMCVCTCLCYSLLVFLATCTVGSLFSVVGCVEIIVAALASVVYNGAFPVLGQNSYYLMSGLYAVSVPALM